MSDTPPDPRADRQRHLVGFLRGALVGIALLGAVDLILPGIWRERGAQLMVACLIAVPIIRILWLVARWTRKGDRRFALAGVALLAVMASGYLLG